ncbi:hypothetical protein MAP00_000838 [Monascus purpureus]|nr:hypothetical protein MAP00_000838 [Monascus purpureus]
MLFSFCFSLFFLFFRICTYASVGSSILPDTPPSISCVFLGCLVFCVLFFFLFRLEFPPMISSFTSFSDEGVQLARFGFPFIHFFPPKDLLLTLFVHMEGA